MGLSACVSLSTISHISADVHMAHMCHQQKNIWTLNVPMNTQHGQLAVGPHFSVDVFLASLGCAGVA